MRFFFTIISISLFCSLTTHALDQTGKKDEKKAEKIERLRHYHKEIMENRIQSLDIRHKKKIEFENEMYEAEKSHLQEIAKMEAGIQTDNHNGNQKLIQEIKEKMHKFQDKMKLKGEAFNKSLQIERERFRAQAKERALDSKKK
ncbi:MAG: hypothetical protein ACOYL6_06905 [Bacteriovoracaceae bacterium]